METKKHSKRGFLAAFWRVAIRTLGAISGFLLLYLAASAAGALLRPGERPPEPDRIYPVYLVWSDLHTDLILPVQGVSVDWPEVLDDDDAPSPPPQDGYVAFGWGSESFYTNVPTLADITPALIARALLFDTTVVHIEPVFDPARIPPDYRLTVMVSAKELAELEQYVLGTFALKPDGGADALAGQSYGRSDAFYHAQGRYNPIGTCNQWTGDALRLVGVPAGYWTPFSQSITWVLGTDAKAGRP